MHAPSSFCTGLLAALLGWMSLSSLQADDKKIFKNKNWNTISFEI